MIHILDEATRFHLGLRIQRNIQPTIKALHQIWFQWAGYPRQIAHDQGGEFMTEDWKNLLLENGIQPILSAAPWQRGRVERHGATVKEMLDRMDDELMIEDAQHFDEALAQCFRAKNSMSIIEGYSPEQAVLGRSPKLPASVVSDEETSAHKEQSLLEPVSRGIWSYEQQPEQLFCELTTARRCAELHFASHEVSPIHGHVDNYVCIGIKGDPQIC